MRKPRPRLLHSLPTEPCIAGPLQAPGDSVMPSPLFCTQMFKSLNLHLESLSGLFRFPCFPSFYSGTLRSIVVPSHCASHLLLHLPSSSHRISRSLHSRTSSPHAIQKWDSSSFTQVFSYPLYPNQWQYHQLLFLCIFIPQYISVPGYLIMLRFTTFTYIFDFPFITSYCVLKPSFLQTCSS